MNTEGSSNKTQGCLAAGKTKKKQKKRKKSKQAQLLSQCNAVPSGKELQRRISTVYLAIRVTNVKKNITVTT